MSSIEFSYNGNRMIIQCNKDDKIKDIINKYILKTSIDKNSVTFLYSGNKIDEELKFLEMIGNEEETKILVLDSKEDINKNRSKINLKYTHKPAKTEGTETKFNVETWRMWCIYYQI